MISVIDLVDQGQDYTKRGSFRNGCVGRVGSDLTHKKEPHKASGTRRGYSHFQWVRTSFPDTDETNNIDCILDRVSYTCEFCINNLLIYLLIFLSNSRSGITSWVLCQSVVSEIISFASHVTVVSLLFPTVLVMRTEGWGFSVDTENITQYNLLPERTDTLTNRGEGASRFTKRKLLIVNEVRKRVRQCRRLGFGERGLRTFSDDPTS